MKVPSKTRAHGGLFLHFIFYFLFFANLLSVYSSFHLLSCSLNVKKRSMFLSVKKDDNFFFI